MTARADERRSVIRDGGKRHPARRVGAYTPRAAEGRWPDAAIVEWIVLNLVGGEVGEVYVSVSHLAHAGRGAPR